uniref:Uncharacterized protein n=1 Tax=Oryza nivara TaxID=4536 RepID=A0A0E0IQG8_ORYNI
MGAAGQGQTRRAPRWSDGSRATQRFSLLTNSTNVWKN